MIRIIETISTGIVYIADKIFEERKKVTLIIRKLVHSKLLLLLF